MGKFDGVLLASDFDDTLCDGKTDVIPERSLARLREFTAEGGRFLIATGRALGAFTPWADKVPMNAPAVLSNGSLIYDFSTKKELEHVYLPEEAAVDCAELCRQFPELAFEAYCGDEIYVFRPNAVTEGHMKKVGCHYMACSIEEMPRPWTKVIFQEDHDYLRTVQKEFLRQWGDRYECIFSSRYLLELTGKDTTKGTAVLKVAGMLGIDRKNIYCIGDNPNDLPMLNCAAIPFVPGNAPEMMRTAEGVHVVSPCAEGAVADVVDALSKIYQ